MRVRWTGTFRPPTSGVWQFASTVDDEVRLYLGGALVGQHGCCVTDPAQFEANPLVHGVPAAGVLGSRALTAGQPVTIRVDYREAAATAAITLYAKAPGDTAWRPVAGDLLSTSETFGLPAGWQMNLGGAEAVFRSAVVRPNGVELTTVDGATIVHARTPAGGFVPPAGDDDSVAVETDGTVTVVSADGTVYRFRSDGQLASMTTPADARQPASIRPVYGTPLPGNQTLVTEMRDPVTNRATTFTYAGSGTCPAGTNAPNGMLCRVTAWDGTETHLTYAAGQLVEVTNFATNAQLADRERITFGYDGNGRLSSVRDVLASETVAVGARTDDTTVRTTITYDSSGRVDTVTMPAPTAGAAQPSVRVVYVNGTTTRVDAVSDAGTWVVQRTVTFDTRGRQLTDADATGVQTTQTWDADPAKDRIVRSTAAGMTSTTVYDHADRPVGTYGPAPAACFQPSGAPVANPTGTAGCATIVPTVTTAYDEGLTGVQQVFWPNTTFGGPPAAMSTSSGALQWSWTGATATPAGLPSPDNWSARFTGELIVASTGVYDLQVAVGMADDARLFIGDEPVAAAGQSHPSTTGSASRTLTAGRHRLRVDIVDHSGDASLTVRWAPSGQTPATVTAGQVAPRLGLVTSSTTDMAPNPARTARTEYTGGGLDPVYGLATAQIVDMGTGNTADNLRTETRYETPGNGTYLRRTQRALPGNTIGDSAQRTTYTYWGATETPPGSECAAGGVQQGGQLRSDVGPDPAGPAAGLTREYRYDNAGRRVGVNINGTGWSCTTLDNRGRAVTQTFPAFDADGAGPAPSYPARTVTTTYRAGGNPLVTQIAEPLTVSNGTGGTTTIPGTISTTVDLLGRVTSTTDVWAKTTTFTFDRLGRTSAVNGPHGSFTYTFDAAGRVETISDNGTLLADPAYDTHGRLNSVTYANGTLMLPLDAGNRRDALGRQVEVAWQLAGGTTLRNTVTRNQAGLITGETTDLSSTAGTDDTRSYTFDRAGRLTDATYGGLLGTANRLYRYAVPSGVAATAGVPNACPAGSVAGAGRNGNRVASSTDNGVTWTVSCHDLADRLLATTDSTMTGTIAYDTRGNTVTVGGQTYGYDGADRHQWTANGSGARVTVVRDALDRIVERSTVTPGNPNPISHIAATTAVAPAAATSVTVNRPAGTAANDVMLASVATPDILPPTGGTLATWTFEGNAGGWANRTNTTVTTTTTARTGTGGLQATVSAAAWGVHAPLPALSVTPSTSYTATGWVRSATSTTTAAMELEWLDAAGNSLSTTQVGTATTTVAAWTQVTGTAVSPATAARVRVRVAGSAATAGAVHVIDDVTVTGEQPGTLPISVNGASQAAATGTSITVNRPAGTQAGDLLLASVVTPATTGGGQTTLLHYTWDTSDEGWAGDSGGWLQYSSSPTQVGTGAGAIGTTAPAFNIRAPWPPQPAAGSTTYNASAWLYSYQNPGQLRIRFDWYSNSNYTSSSETASVTTQVGAWTQITGSVTSPAGTTAVQMRVLGTGTSGNWHAIDDLRVTTGTGGGATTVTAPAGWALVQQQPAVGVVTHVYRATATGSDPSGWTWNLNGTAATSAGIVALGGTEPNGPVETVAVGANGVGSVHGVGPVGTGGSNRMVVAVTGLAGSGVFSANGVGFTERVDVTAGAGTSVQIATGPQPVRGWLTGITATSSVSAASATVAVSVTPRLAPAVVVTAPAGWTPVMAAGSGARASVFVRTASGSEPVSFAFTVSPAVRAAVAVSTYRGVDPAGPIDIPAVHVSGTGTAANAPSVVPGGSGRMVVNVTAAATGTTASPPSGGTERADIASGTTAADVVVSTSDQGGMSAATGTRTTTLAVSARWTAGSVLLRPTMSASTTTVQRYVHAGGGDNPVAVAGDGAGTPIIERFVGLPGGMAVTRRTGGDVWSVPNLHGTTIATLTPTGALTGGVVRYDPYGNLMAGTVDNLTGTIDYGWLGAHQRGSDSHLQPIIHMGARPYHPRLGRFLETDPIEGGVDNDYTYPVGPDQHARPRRTRSRRGGARVWACRGRAWVQTVPPGARARVPAGPPIAPPPTAAPHGLARGNNATFRRGADNRTGLCIRMRRSFRRPSGSYADKLGRWRWLGRQRVVRRSGS
jgi:RHS repeat-associated protein